MKLEDWHESVQGYVIDCLDWFDLERYDSQAKSWDVLQWRNAIVKRHVLAKMSEASPPKKELLNMFIYLNDDTNDDLFFSAPKRDNHFDMGNCYHLNEDLDTINLIPFYAECLANKFGGFYIVPPKIKPCVQSLTCESAYELYEDMENNLLFENEKNYRYGVSKKCDEQVSSVIPDENVLMLVKIDENAHQPRLKNDEWNKPYYEIVDNSFGRRLAEKLVEINLAAPKKEIEIAFKKWLNKAKQDFNYPDPVPRPGRSLLKLETRHFQKWMEWRLLAFIDFAYWRKMSGKPRLNTITDYLSVVFPDPKLRCSVLNTIKTDEFTKETSWLLLPSTMALLDAASEIYPRNHPAVLNPPRP